MTIILSQRKNSPFNDYNNALIALLTREPPSGAIEFAPYYLTREEKITRYHDIVLKKLDMRCHDYDKIPSINF